jgi:hypothetical protein
MDPVRWPGSKWRCLLVCIYKRTWSPLHFFIFYFQMQIMLVHWRLDLRVNLALFVWCAYVHLRLFIMVHHTFLSPVWFKGIRLILSFLPLYLIPPLLPSFGINLFIYFNLLFPKNILGSFVDISIMISNASIPIWPYVWGI